MVNETNVIASQESTLDLVNDFYAAVGEGINTIKTVFLD